MQPNNVLGTSAYHRSSAPVFWDDMIHSTENSFIRFPRGALAILCFFGILALVLYAAIFQPQQWSARPNVKVSKIPVVNGNLFETFTSTLGYYAPAVRIILTVPVSAELD